jgi:hypothetical protein
MNIHGVSAMRSLAELIERDDPAFPPPFSGVGR